MKKTIKILLGLVGILLLAFILLLLYLMVTEYKPKDVEEIAVTGTRDQKLEQDHDYKLLTCLLYTSDAADDCCRV